MHVAPLPGTRAQPHPQLLTTFLRSKTTALKPPSPQLGELDLAGTTLSTSPSRFCLCLGMKGPLSLSGHSRTLRGQAEHKVCWVRTAW